MTEPEQLQQVVYIDSFNPQTHPNPEGSPLYQIILLPDPAAFAVDFISHKTGPWSLLFLSPYQHVAWKSPIQASLSRILFHGDFYCIEYHKAEVACNGLLFNNIYLQPFVTLDSDAYPKIEQIVQEMKRELNEGSHFSDSVIKSYLQLVLALSSKAKRSISTSHRLKTMRKYMKGRYFRNCWKHIFRMKNR